MEVLEPVRSVDAHQPVQLAVGDDGAVEVNGPARRRLRVEEVALRPDPGVQRRDQFLTNGVERRVGHLGEELLEEVVDGPVAVREHRRRRVGAHRAQRLLAVDGHGGEKQPVLLVGVPEHLLALDQRALLTPCPPLLFAALTGRQVVETDQVLVQPRPVGAARGEAVLDLVVAHDAALGGVDQEHAPGLQPSLLHHRALGHVDDAGLRRHHHEAVAGDLVAGGTQAVAIQHRADDGAVGEGDRGGTVPRLHAGGVVLVERLALGAHLGVMLPRLGDHHQHGLCHRVAAEGQQFEHLVEAGGVAGAGSADREGPLDALQVRRRQQGLAGPHPVAVAGDGVDLAVVGDHAVGVGQRP